MKLNLAGLVIAVAAGIISGAPLADAAATAQAPHVQVELVSSRLHVPPGDSFPVGLFFKLEKGWHIYWRNAGDYGEPPKAKWTAIPGATIGDLQWPLPERIVHGTIVSFGYEDEVLLPVAVRLDSGFSGSVLPLHADLRWLVCREVCIPGKAQLSLDVPVQAGAAAPDPANASRFLATGTMLPQTPRAEWKASGRLGENDLHLNLAGLSADSFVALYPAVGDEIDNGDPGSAKKTANGIELKFKRSDRLVNALDSFAALLILKNGEETFSYSVDFPLEGARAPGSSAGILLPLFFAFLGGLILNLMPCVFPILSIKAMSFLKMSGEDRTHMRARGWAYTLGILVSFWLLVGALLLLRLGGQQIGWGFQLQSPTFVFAMACVFFAFALNLLGVFEIAGRFTGVGGSLAGRSGWAGSFFTGVLATLVATPCSAPFMGSAIGFALGQSVPVVFTIFTALGFGLALPYLLLCYLPGLGRILPKPGAWMETFRQFMAFLILGTLLWLSWVLSLQTGSPGLLVMLASFVGIALAAWIANRWHHGFIALLLGLAFVAAGGYELRTLAAPGSPATEAKAGGLNWEKFSPEKVAELRAQGHPVFVDFTAAWCVSCQVNELMVFRSEAVQQKLKEMGVALLKADWTNQDPVITRTLATFHRDGVPFYLIYRKEPDAPAIPLPEVITAGLVLNELEKLK